MVQEKNENATKRLIRKKAMNLFRETSFEAVTIGDICKASGVNKHTFYYYFKSKDELLEDYYRLPWHLSTAEVAEILASENSVDQLWYIFRKFITFISSIGLPILKQVLVKNLSEDLGTLRVSKDMKEFFVLERSILEKGQKSGQFRNQTDSRILLITLQQVFLSLSVRWTVFEGNFDLEKSIRLMFEQLLDVEESYRITTEQDLDECIHGFMLEAFEKD